MPSKEPVLIGYLNSAGHPAIKLGVYGVHPDLKQEFEVMIDTGFTGFLLMPIMSAFPLGLTLVGTGSYTLADNSTSAKLLALGNLTIGNEDPVAGIIVLEPNQCSPLLGMDFLRKAERCLSVSVNGVALIDESLVQKFLETVAAQAIGAEPNDPSTVAPKEQTRPEKED
jgi:predicted aspartyl protease